MPVKKTETKKTTKQTKTTDKKQKKTETENKTKEEFSFGSVKKMSKEERNSIIEEALQPINKTSSESLKWTVDETEYEPKEWVVVLTPDGNIYQEPVPRYWNYQHFVDILAGIPDNPINNSKIGFNAELHKTSFEVKGLECYINTVSHDGTRRENSYATAFKILNGTTKIGGNLVFANSEKGFTKKQCKSVVEQIIKKLENYEEKVDF